MKTLLQIQTSMFSAGGQSSQLAEQFVAEWRKSNPRGQVVKRDIGAEPIPHLTAERFQSFLAAPEARTPDQQAVAGFSDVLIEELKRADVIVLGLPMYNFGVPSTLKAYFDHVARSGLTFRYSEKGPEGLLKGKKAYIFAARGGVYSGTPLDTQTSYVRDFLRFLGIDDLEFIYAEGLAMGDAAKADALSKAGRKIQSLAARELAHVPYAA